MDAEYDDGTLRELTVPGAAQPSNRQERHRLLSPPQQIAKKDLVFGTRFLSDGCPFSTAPLSEAECREAAALFSGSEMADPFTVSNEEDPQGCFSFRNIFFFNTFPYDDRKREGRTLYCRRIRQQRYVKLISGSCSLHGFMPIHDEDECEVAAKELGLPQQEALSTSEQNRTEGCYYFHNFEEVSASLWIDKNPDNEGIGFQEDSDFRRQPICQMPEPPARRYTQADLGTPQRSPAASTASKRRANVTLPGRVVTIDGPIDRCPPGTEALTEDECRALPNSTLGFDAVAHKPFVISSDKDPSGCFRFWEWYYYNTHHRGKGRSERQLQCKRVDRLNP